MKNRLLALICTGLLSFQLTASSQESSTPFIEKNKEDRDELVTEEKPATVVAEVIETKKVEESDIVNFISRIDEEKIDSREKYARRSSIEGFYLALEDELKKDPLFYAWQEYGEGDFIVKNQMLNAGWDLLVGKYPDLFGRIEKAGVYAKRKTTVEIREIGGYRLKVNPELDSDSYPILKFRVRNGGESFWNDLYLKLGKGEAEIGKNWLIPRFGREASFNFNFASDYNGEYSVKLTLKFPFGFGGERIVFSKGDNEELESLIK